MKAQLKGGLYLDDEGVPHNAEGEPWTAFPKGFPGASELREADIHCVEQIEQMDKDDLKDVKGIGATTAKKILAAVAALRNPPEEEESDDESGDEG